MEHKPERRKLLLAILASVLLHFAVAISLASFGDKLQPSPPEEERPVELTIVNLGPTPTPVRVPKNAPLIDTPEKRATKEEPKEKTFESNANSIASSQLPALGQAPVPTQEGKDRPNMDLESHQHSLGLQGGHPSPAARPTSPPPTIPSPTPAPSASATSTPQPTSTPTPPATPRPTIEPTTTPEQFAMLRATPPPPIRAPDQLEASPTPEMTTPPLATRPTPPPEQPASSYRPEQTQTRMTGNISNRGIASVNAIGTPLGRYNKQLQDAVGSRWYMYVERQRDLVSIGTVHLRFVIDRSGRVANLKLVSNSSNESFANVCLLSVQEVKLPPIPEDVANTLPPEGLDEELTFTIYPNY